MNTKSDAECVTPNPLAEILEPIRQRVLRERLEQDKRDGCMLIDWQERIDDRPPGL